MLSFLASALLLVSGCDCCCCHKPAPAPDPDYDSKIVAEIRSGFRNSMLVPYAAKVGQAITWSSPKAGSVTVEVFRATAFGSNTIIFFRVLSNR